MDKKIESFVSHGIVQRGQFDDLAGTAMSTDNEILVADMFNHRIQMCTL